MPSLYHSVIEAPSHVPQFSCHTLHLTKTLLREKEPELAQSIHSLLADLAPQDVDQRGITNSHLDHFTLLDNLGASGIGKIIVTLTQLGNGWLCSDPKHPESLMSLNAILLSWIELGEWLVEQSTDH